jgi:peptidoglycan/LPS O-acetylase OafA/YrhL
MVTRPLFTTGDQRQLIMNRRLAHLDLMRGVAALLVCVEHLRAFLMTDYGHILHPLVTDRIFYFVTGLGHQAVMIFFVLSGYFVGGSVISAYEEKKWSWSRYTTRRLSRLWVVLVPALVLTLIWDEAGRSFNQAGYAGSYHIHYCSGPSPQIPADFRPSTFFGNCFFLQTICVPVFGTNGPLWSLANEFWYYILFPLFWGLFNQAKFSYKAISGFLAVAIAVCLPSEILWGGLIWLFGVAAFLVSRNNSLRPVCGHYVWLILTGILAAASLAASKTSSLFGSNMAMGAAFALFVTGLAIRNSSPRLYSNLAACMGETSYTLYVAHFPFLAFIFFVFFKGERLQPDLAGFVVFFGVLLLTFAYASLIWCCFERNTNYVRKQLELCLRLEPCAK